MQSPDHPELVYLEARTSTGGPMYTVGRPDGKPLWVVIHDMEKTESPDCAEWTANYFHTGAGGRSVSSHYTADDTSIVQCVLLRNSAWTVGNRPGNNRGINWELCGYAAQTRDQWLDPFGRAMFDQMVPIIRSDAAKYGIPLVRRSIAELRLWIPGVTSHNDLRLAFNVTDHTDPGSNFPWDYFIDLLQGSSQEDDVPLFVRVKESGAIYVSTGVEYWHLTGETYPVAAAAWGKTTWDYQVDSEEDMAAFGVPVHEGSDGGGGGGPLEITLTGTAVPT
jgi:hypothetical protein